MPINKIVNDIDEALTGVVDGCSLLIGGFGGAGMPFLLLEELAKRSLRDLTVISNNAGVGYEGLGALFASHAVRRVVCSYPRSKASVFGKLYADGEIELEVVPQGTLSERIRAGGAGIGGFYTRTGVGTTLTQGRECRTIAGQPFVLEFPLRADFALLHASRGDRWGNLTYSKASRNFGPVMATAADVVVAEVDEVVAQLDPETIVTPGIFVDRVLAVSR
jgi:3-oxoadipate CoA-transferase alpha subunit